MDCTKAIRYVIQRLKTEDDVPIVFAWVSHRQDLVSELPWILGQEEEQVVVMLGIPRGDHDFVFKLW